MNLRLDDRIALGLLILLQLALMLIVQPHGNFPLNDDWAYAHSVEWVLREGRLRLSDWIAPNILPQVLLASAVSWLAGYSLETLRHVTQFMALATSVAGYFWFRSCRLPASHALVATLVVLAMPSWAVLANSFMTDLYGLFLALCAATLFLKALQSPSTLNISAAAILSSLGVLQRQVLLVLPFAFLLAWLWRCLGDRFRLKALLTGLFPLMAAVVALYAYRWYLDVGPGIPKAQAKGTSRFLPLLISALQGENAMRQFVLYNLATMIAYLGWFFAPWAAWWGEPKSRRTVLILLTGTALLTSINVLLGWLPPYLKNNTIDAAGIGPFTLFDAMPRQLSTLSRDPGVLWVIVGTVAAGGIIAVLALIWRTLRWLVRRRTLGTDSTVVFLAATILAYAVPFLLTGYFDRYLLFLLPFMIALWCKLWPHVPTVTIARPWASAALLWVGVTLLTAAVATHDYFSWNRARWAAIEYGETLGATPESMDGGFEYNAYHRFEAADGVRLRGKSWWWVKDDAFIVTFSAVPGYRVIREFPVDRHLNRTPSRILLSARLPADPSD